MKEGTIKQSGFRTLSSEQISAVSGGFRRNGDGSGSENAPSNEGPGLFDIPGEIIDKIIDYVLGPSDEDNINSAALEGHVEERGTDKDGNKYILTTDGFTFTDTDGNGFYDTQSKTGPNGTIYSTTDGEKWVRQYYISIGAEVPNNFN